MTLYMRCGTWTSECLEFNESDQLLTLILSLSLSLADQSAVIKTISLYGLLPETDFYMTYDGSTTHPGCWESVTWVILNKPIYVSRQIVSYPLRKPNWRYHSPRTMVVMDLWKSAYTFPSVNKLYLYYYHSVSDLGSSSAQARESTRGTQNPLNERETNSTHASQDSEDKYKFLRGSGECHS
jgi:hypothetical protein